MMDVRLHWSADATDKHCEEDLRSCVVEIFERCPGLTGFSVAERLVSSDTSVREWELYVSDIAASPGSSADPSKAFHDDISQALGSFLSERPEAADLLNGRTFARTWH
jgi:hypothetical protein